ncbi:Uncharacterised protein [Klebsiella pneumoniae]|nr:Uncharacterised protein [Klebsiella pneumoniae]
MNQIVKFGDQLRQVANVVWYSQAGAELLDQLNPRRAVTMMARPERFRRQPFPQVVA